MPTGDSESPPQPATMPQASTLTPLQATPPPMATSGHYARYPTQRKKNQKRN